MKGDRQAPVKVTEFWLHWLNVGVQTRICPKNETHKILWDFKKVSPNPDQKDQTECNSKKKKKPCQLVASAVPASQRIKITGIFSLQP